MSFFSFPMYANVDMISPRPILLVAGEKAHSRSYSEDVYKIAAEPKELLMVPGADHVDLYVSSRPKSCPRGGAREHR